MSEVVYFPIFVLIIMFSLLIYRLHEIYKIFNVERFSNNNNQTTYCNFKPDLVRPHNKNDCVLKCANKIGTQSNCTYSGCEQICSECDEISCNWNRESESPDHDKYADYFNNLKDTSDIPNRIRDIKLEPYYGAVKVSFLKPNTINYKPKILGYVYYMYKTFKRHEGVFLGKFVDENCLFCNNLIKDLDPRENYSIGVRAYNENGMGAMSEIVTFRPVDKIDIKNYHLIPAVSPVSNNLKFCNKN